MAKNRKKSKKNASTAMITDETAIVSPQGLLLFIFIYVQLHNVFVSALFSKKMMYSFDYYVVTAMDTSETVAIASSRSQISRY
ncbi:hypothetical protein HanPI659440_Chr05g0214541 [Helianthus annuus]|nr:hypothetical protein HanPI659440_Chr05g0214541 [Helianthus annuus]